MMIRIKVLGLALVAVFAMGALASSAMALPALETNVANVTLKGEQAAGTNDVFTVDGSNVTCENATYNANGTTANGATNAVLHPEYNSCTAFGFIGANISTANCNYRGMATGAYEEANMFYNSAELEIICGANPITINAGSGTCVATVSSQTISGTTLHISNVTNTPMDFRIHATSAPVKTKKNADNFGCPFNGTGETTGTYTGTTTVICIDNLTIVGCTVKG